MGKNKMTFTSRSTKKTGSCGLIERDLEILGYILENNNIYVGWHRLYCRCLLFETFSIVYRYCTASNNYNNICLQ